MKKLLAPVVAAVIGWVFTQLAFPHSAPDCQMMYGAAAAFGGAAITSIWIWMPHRTLAELPDDDWYVPQYPQYPQYPAYQARYVDAAWAENQREMARLMWLDGTPTPPTDWYGARG